MTDKLKDQLQSLHTQLSEADAVDPESRELLAAVMSDIHRILDPQHARDDRSLALRLETLAVKFEAGHPALGAAIRQVVESLSNAGI